MREKDTSKTQEVIKRPRYDLPKGTQRNWFTEKFEKTLRLGFSISMVVVGKRTGISKTYCTAKMAQSLDPKGFTAKDVEEGKYSFYAKDFIQVLKNIDYYRWAIFDEPARKGSGGNRQEWQSDVNKALSSTLQISRFKVPVTPFILPHRNYLASQVFGLAQLMMVFNDRGVCDVYKIQVSEFTGDIFTPKVGRLRFGFPDKDLADAIEKKKREMFNEDTEKWTARIIRDEKTQTPTEDLVKEIKNNNSIKKYLTEKAGKTVVDVKALKIDYPYSNAKLYELKGILDREIDADRFELD
jgi:hypothetical protein